MTPEEYKKWLEASGFTKALEKFNEVEYPYTGVISEFKSKQGIPDKYGRTDIEYYLYRIDLEADHSDIEGEIKFLRDLYKFILGVYPECDPYQKR